MTLQYSYLSEVFPEYENSSRVLITQDDSLPAYFPNNVEKILDLQPNEKLRIVNHKLEIDTRKFKNICRKYTGDSRWKILKKILEIENVNLREFYLGILRSSTYSKDVKWVEASIKKY